MIGAWEVREMKNKKSLLIITVLLLMLFICLCFRSCTNSDDIGELLPIDDIAEIWQGNQQLPGKATESGRIEIPGFKTLVFAKNERNQKVNFYNPESNDCLFLMTLYVDNEELWKSGYVQPNKGYYDIELNKTLKEGNYEAYLLIECYKEDGKKLNSAKVQFELLVQ